MFKEDDILPLCFKSKCNQHGQSLQEMGVFKRNFADASLEPFNVSLIDTYHTGRFIMFSMITNIYNKKTKGPALMEFFTATGKMIKIFLTTRDVRLCTTGDKAHIDEIFKFLPHTCQHVDTCVART